MTRFDRARAIALVDEIRNIVFQEGSQWSWLLRWFNDIATILKGEDSDLEAQSAVREIVNDLYTRQRGISEFYVYLPELPERRAANEHFQNLLNELRGVLGM